MRLYEIEKKDISSIVEIIEYDCSEFLAMSSNKPIWRGYTPLYNDIIRKTTKTRTPTHSDSAINTAWNKAMKKLKIEARRDNSIFCTTSKDVAKRFSRNEDGECNSGKNIFCVFPIDGFSFAWNRRETDSVLHDEKYLDMYRMVTYIKTQQKNIQNRTNIVSQKQQLWRDDLSQLMTSFINKPRTYYYKELVEQAAVYGITLRPHDYFFDKKKILSDIATQIQTTDLKTGMNLGKEIMITGSYYLVNTKNIDVKELYNTLYDGRE